MRASSEQARVLAQDIRDAQKAADEAERSGTVPLDMVLKEYRIRRPKDMRVMRGAKRSR